MHYSRKCIQLLIVCSACLLALAQPSDPELRTLPVLYTCQEALITWTGGQAPFTLTITSSTGTSAGNVETFTNIDGNSYSWLPDIGLCSITADLNDANNAFSQEVFGVVWQGGSNDCYSGGGYTVDTSGSGDSGGSGTDDTTTSAPSARTSALGAGTASSMATTEAYSQQPPSSKHHPFTPTTPIDPPTTCAEGSPTTQAFTDPQAGPSASEPPAYTPSVPASSSLKDAIAGAAIGAAITAAGGIITALIRYRRRY